MQKHALRSTIRTKRKGHTAPDKRQKDTQIQKRLEAMEEFRDARTVLLYAPIPHEKEVNTWGIITKYAKTKTLVLPKINMARKTMSLHLITGRADTKPNTLKIPEPLPHCRRISPSDIDLAVIPGIAFDIAGNRLGFGHGYYDRLLKKLRCPIVALAYELQIVKQVPRDAHDVPVHHIVTENRIHAV